MRFTEVFECIFVFCCCCVFVFHFIEAVESSEKEGETQPGCKCVNEKCKQVNVFFVFDFVF